MRIIISAEDFEKYCKVFDQMKWQAGKYAPTEEEINNRILPNMKDYALFLIWIDCTGVETPANKKSREWIRDILRDSLEIIEEKEETK